MGKETKGGGGEKKDQTVIEARQSAIQLGWEELSVAIIKDLDHRVNVSDKGGRGGGRRPPELGVRDRDREEHKQAECDNYN